MNVGFTASPIAEQEFLKRLYAESNGKIHAVCAEGHRVRGTNALRRGNKDFCRRCVQSGFIRFEPPPRPIQTVYFIADGHGNIKIGIAASVPMRLDSLQTANASELTLLATMPGGRDMEHDLHAKFVQHRIRGEWFRPAPEILDYIDVVRAEQEPKRRPRKVPDYVTAQQEAAARQEAAV